MIAKRNEDGELEVYDPQALLDQYDKASDKNLLELMGMGNRLHVDDLGSPL